MINKIVLLLITLILTPTIGANESLNQTTEQPILEKNMPANDAFKLSTGIFDVNLEPQADESAPAGRMLINKTYEGGLKGTGTGQMISKRTEKGPAVYFAIEEFIGSVEGKEGSFTLLHKGYMSAEEQSLEVDILDGSGSKELESISGSLTIIQKDGKHYYEFNYNL